MATLEYPILCHWRGVVEETTDRIKYIGGYKRMILINKGIDFDGFVNLLCERCNIDRRNVELKVKMGVRCSIGPEMVDLVDDYSLAAMWVYINQSLTPAIYVHIGQTNPESNQSKKSKTGYVGTSSTCIRHEVDLQISLLSQSNPVLHYVNQEDCDPNSGFVITAYNKDGRLPASTTEESVQIEEIERQLEEDDESEESEFYFDDSSEFAIGQRFDTRGELLLAVRLYSIRRNRFYHPVVTKPNLVVLKCCRSPCPWQLRARVVDSRFPFFTIVEYGGLHTCVNNR